MLPLRTSLELVDVSRGLQLATLARNAQNSKPPEGRRPRLVLPLWYCVLSPPRPRPLQPTFGYAARSTRAPQVWDRQMLDRGEVVLKPIPSRPPLLAESRIVLESQSLAVVEEAPIYSTSWCWHLVTAAHIHTIVQLHERCQVVIFHRSVGADPLDAIAGTGRRL